MSFDLLTDGGPLVFGTVDILSVGSTNKEFVSMQTIYQLTNLTGVRALGVLRISTQ